MTRFTRTSADLIKTYTNVIWALNPKNVARFEQRYDELLASDDTAETALEQAYEEVSSEGYDPSQWDSEGRYIG